MPHMGGYYWVGAYVNDVCAVFGSDDGTSGSDSPTAVLYSVNPVTGSIIDTINNVTGDIRCCIVYDSGRVYFTTKGGISTPLVLIPTARLTMPPSNQSR